MDLLSRLRARLVAVPKPGTEPREIRYGEWFTFSTGGKYKAGEDAGEQSLPSVSMYTGHNPPMRVQQHVYVVEPLCEEAAKEIERLTLEREQLREALADAIALKVEPYRPADSAEPPPVD